MRKNTLKIFSRFAVVLGFAAIFASCSNLSDANVIEKGARTRTLSIAISNYNELVKSSPEMQKVDNTRRAISNLNSANQRTIISDSFTFDSGDLYLFGTDANGNQFKPTKVNFTATDGTNTVGTIAIPTNQGTYNWDFTLALVPTGVTLQLNGTYADDVRAVKNEAVLIGYSSMDMANGDKAAFTLSPDGLTKEGDINMTVYLDNWELPDDVDSTTIGIYKLTDGSIVNDAEDVPASTERTYNLDATGTETATEFFKLTKTEPAAANYVVTKMNPGTYTFKVTFEKTTEKKKFIWSDVIIVLPGKQINNTIAIPNVIGEKPIAPTSFDAKYIVNSEDKPNGYYTTEFTWVRDETKKNENFFEIDVLKIDNGETITTAMADDDWETLFNNAKNTDKLITYGDKFLSSAEYVSGSLLSGNKTAQLRLALGLRYFARIRAVNDAGVSEYKYVTFDTNTDDATKKAFTSTTINRYRLTYFLSGGTLTQNNTPYVGDNYVEYYCQDENPGTTILTPAVGTATTLEYTNGKGTFPWTEWQDDNKTAYTDTAYKGFANLNLYAFYSVDADVELYDHNSYRIKDTWITVTVGTEPAQNITPSVNQNQDSGTVTINAKDANGNAIEKATWTFKPVDDNKKITGDFKFDSVSFVVNQGGQYKEVGSAKDVDTTNGFTFDMNLKPLTNGRYNVMFTAITGRTTVSYPITLEITR